MKAARIKPDKALKMPPLDMKLPLPKDLQDNAAPAKAAQAPGPNLAHAPEASGAYEPSVKPLSTAVQCSDAKDNAKGAQRLRIGEHPGVTRLVIDLTHPATARAVIDAHSKVF